MTKNLLAFPAILLCLLSSLSPVHGDVITQWTFETFIPPTETSSSINGIFAEFGVGQASGVHAASNTKWDDPSGAGGSSRSFSANNWAVDDYFQFTTSTVAFENIELAWAQRGSGTGPRDFKLSYQVNGGSFVDFASYTVTTTTFTSASTKQFDLSGITVLNNAAEVNFRVTATSTNSINGGTSLGSSGTSVVDNFTVMGAAIPEPSSLAFLVGGLALVWARRKSVSGQ